MKIRIEGLASLVVVISFSYKTSNGNKYKAECKRENKQWQVKIWHIYDNTLRGTCPCWPNQYYSGILPYFKIRSRLKYVANNWDSMTGEQR